MIGSLRGVLTHKDPPYLVVEVHGIGYELEAPVSTWGRLPAVGETVVLRTHLVIREDQHSLFGFATEPERRLFRDLLKVSGIGARIALAILSGISVEGFIRCVQADDAAALTKVPGIGRKTAERLILDMRDRIADLAPGISVTAVAPDPSDQPATTQVEVVNALVSLGYKPAEARRMLQQLGTASGSAEDLLRAALRAAAPAVRG
jgi:Holliday junction DNA helicase RuvA